MPFTSSDSILQIQVTHDADGWFVKIDGERITTVSSATLNATDRRKVGQALTLRKVGPSGLVVLIQGSDNGSGAPVQDTLVNLTEA